MSNNTKDSKSPLQTLQEAAAALNREASTLAGNGSARVILGVKAVREAAPSLQQLAKVLGWIGEPLEWIAKPLQRTAAALMELTPADLAEKEAMREAADAIGVAAEAVRGSESLLSDEGEQKLKVLPVATRHDKNALISISVALKETATFLEGNVSGGPPSYLVTYAEAAAAVIQ